MSDACAMPLPSVADASQQDLASPAWRQRLAAYAKPDASRAITQLVNTGLPFLAVMAALLYGIEHGLWLAALLALPAALFVVRLFAIQHDCGHGSFFASHRANHVAGLVISALTLMPYGSWRRAHAVHHATSGNLDRRGTGDITTFTVAEYRAKPWWRKIAYRIYRHPLMLFAVGPAYVVLFHYRFPIRPTVWDRDSALSMLGNNLAIAAIFTGLSLIVSPLTVFIAAGAVLFLATAIGMWLFCIQHQFEGTYWERGDKWDFHTAAIEGSSFYDLPWFLRWFTGSIGLHHIHHLASKIPNYHLHACFAENPELQRARRLTLWASIQSVRLALWDEERHKLISFRQAALQGA